MLLGIFNLIPIPPLDGGRIAVGLLPRDMAEKYAAIEPYGMWIIVLLLVLDPIGIWPKIIGPIITGIAGFFLGFAGFPGYA